MGKKQFGAALAVAAAAMGLAPLQAGAAVLSFDHAAGGGITVSACDFEFGAFVNGAVMGSCGAGYGGITTVSPVPGPVTFSGGWADLGITIDGARTIYLVEASDPTMVSDIIDIAWARRAPDPNEATGVNISVTFRSDLAGPLGTVPPGTDPGNVFAENGQTVSFAGSPLLSEPQYLLGTIVTPSANGVVPEPGSLALLGLGLAGIGFTRRRSA